MPRELFEAEISRAHPRRANRGKDPRATMWILSGLLTLVEELYDRPVQHLAPTIRSLIAEQSFAADADDAVVDTQRGAQIELQVDLIVRVLEKVRVMALRQGLWSSHPATHPCSVDPEANIGITHSTQVAGIPYFLGRPS